ncbi:acylphosphatase [Candidatus Daviesbacteria bacterium]|nr:acylphosphatase [Candidatus Daviesbacteria bacterium]
MKKHLNIKVTGLVQGVFFRVSAKDQADKLSIKGFARNEKDGSVYIEAEGEKENLNKFLAWCHKSPTLAKVEEVEIRKDPLKNFSEFEIK